MKEKGKFDRKLPQNLENLHTYKSKEFWNLLRQIKANSNNKSPEYQTLNDLDKCYKNLQQKNCNLTKQEFPEPLNTKPNDSLSQIATIEEIKESIKYLKTK